MSSSAQQELLRKWTIPLPPLLDKVAIPGKGEIEEYSPWTFPGTSILSPIAYGANWGDVFGAISFQNRSRFSTNPDMVAGFGMGIGNAQKYVGLEISYAMTDVSAILPWKSSGSLSFKLHKLFPGGLGLAIGIDDAVVWIGSDADLTKYGVVSKAFFFSPNEESLFSALLLHAGVGDGNFRKETDVIAGVNKMNFFASAGVRVIRPATFIVNWYGSDLGVGISVAPFRRTKLVFNLAAEDLTRSAGDGVRFLISTSYAINIYSVLE